MPKKQDKVFIVQIKDWGKHNPRSDRGGFSWSKLDNQFHLHMRERRGYSATATNLCLLLFQESSRVDGRELRIRLGFAANLLGYTMTAVEMALRELERGHDEAGGEIFLKALEDVSTTLQAASSVDRQTDGQDREDKTDTAEGFQDSQRQGFDFEASYLAYPRRVNKSEARKRFLEVIHSPEDFAALLTAIGRYAEHVAKNRTEERYIMHMTTFLEKRESKPFVQPWRDWLEPDAGTVKRLESEEPAWVREAKRKEAERKASGL